ncbi:MAG TPA: class III extradiol ring-cleavage dioxygenase [Candidatus Nanopelagicaceae bacterium]|nr:class III extradiol ring-cleavage dioxygenase [Candidatus Nanopelagicaceae bacterium]
MTVMPSIYLGHGAPPLVDDPFWPDQLTKWSAEIPTPKAILVVSAHWESAPLTIGATDLGVPLTYDFYGFPQRYYQVQYAVPGAPELANRVEALMPDNEPIAHQPQRGLDHGAYVPLTVMYPKAEIPVLQISMPTLDPARLLQLGKRLSPLREEGVLIIGSGFLTHGLPYVSFGDPHGVAPTWSSEFDHWCDEALMRGDVDTLLDFKHRAPGMPYAHPTTEHFAPLFVALGAAIGGSTPPTTKVDGYWYGLAKRSYEMA